MEFSKASLDIEIDFDAAEDALLSFLRYHDVEILFASRDSRAVLPQTRTKPSRRLRYAVSRFAIEAQKTKPDVFRTLCEIALGHVITAAILLDGI